MIKPMRDYIFEESEQQAPTLKTLCDNHNIDKESYVARTLQENVHCMIKPMRDNIFEESEQQAPTLKTLHDNHNTDKERQNQHKNTRKKSKRT